MDGKPLRILRVVQSTYPEVIGGIGIHVHDMSRKQAELGHEVTVLTSDNGDRSLPRREKRDGYTLVRYRELARPIDNSITPGMIRSLHRRAPDFDIVHTHSHLYFSSNVAAAISKLTNTDLVLTNHGLFSQTAPMSIQKAYLKTLGKFTLNSADRIFCYTERAENLLEDHGISTPAKIVHNGINCEMFSPSNPGSSEKQILFVGRLKPGKQPDVLIDAFTKVVREHPEYQLKVVGDGPMLDELEHLCRESSVDEQVTFTGELSYEEMPSVYNESEFLVLPTKTEAAIPRVVMEAWACETPAIMTNIREIDGDEFATGGITTDGMIDDLYEQMCRLIEDEDLRRDLGESGRNHVSENYSWAETVEETTAEYYEVIDE